MGCINSKKAAAASLSNHGGSPVYDRENAPGLISGFTSKNPSSHHRRVVDVSSEDIHARRLRESRKLGNDEKSDFSLKFGLFYGNVEAEQIAAGWPAWLSSAAAEAVHGWVPLQAEAFEKLEKIGQGTYSSVFRAREVESGKMVALKKVKFDNFQAESIRFMAREIMLLRKLDHPNIMKLEGIITSRMSNSIYLVFEYMEHDLAGLSSNPDIKFTESQVKCYMKQLLWGLEHCHLRGVVHRDIKASNILVNNQGILKLGDFGLANIITPRNKNQLTSRVVTLWYRAPELLMGSTSYGVYIDLWSVGCVFAEILLGKPILKGRTEIEQLHKIYKLCGSPSEEFWRKCRLPHATVYKPQHPYESILRERCKEFSTSAVNLLETFLSIEPDKRGTASSALISEYFHTKPYACDPSSLPKYPPNKEIDAKHREELRRKKASIKMRDSGATKKPRRPRKTGQESKNLSKLPPRQEAQEDKHFTYQNTRNNSQRRRETILHNSSLYDNASEISQDTTATQGDYFLYTNLSQATAPARGFAWAKRPKDPDNISTLTCNQLSSRSQVSGTSIAFAKNTFGFSIKEDEDPVWEVRGGSYRGVPELIEISKERKLGRFGDRQESFDEPGLYFSGVLREEGYPTKNSDYINLGVHSSSGPLIFQSGEINELLQRNESNIRRVVRRSQLGREHQ